MAEPETASGQPNPILNSNTVGWEERKLADPTVEYLDRSTPGPQRADHSTHSATTDPLPPQVKPPLPADEPDLPVIPGYRIVGILGRGGMGTVFEAVHLDMNRTVALKLIHATGRDESAVRGRFEREVRSLARIDHPNVVPVYDAGSWHGFPFYTMKLVSGGALSHNLERIRGDLRAAVRLVATVARTVHHLHANGILHRDLKPLNVLLGANDEPLVADFGLARCVDDELEITATGFPVGTRQYMSPEQTTGRREGYTAACDIWAVGVILYEVLCGRRPFVGEEPTSLMRSIREDAPAPCTAFNPDTPPELEAVARKCLEKNPEDRYPTAEAVADDLDNWLAGQPVSAPRPLVSLVPPRRRWVRWAGLGIGLFALGFVIALALWNRPDPGRPKPRTIADRLRAGETVPLTDEKGKPLVDPLRIPGYDVYASFADRDGYFVFSHTGTMMAELVDEALDLPVVLDAEVSLAKGKPSKWFVGLYAGHRAWPGRAVTHHSAVRFAVARNESNPIDLLTTKARAIWWRPGGSGIDGLGLGIGDGSDRWPQAEPGSDRIFTAIRVVIRDQQFDATIRGFELKPIVPVPPNTTAQSFGDLLRDRTQQHPELIDYPFAPPYFGSGLGITLESTQAVFRNVRLSPLPPP